MKYIFLTLILIGCGTEDKATTNMDEQLTIEQYLTKDENILERRVYIWTFKDLEFNSSIDIDTKTSTAADKCQNEKLCRGMTAEEIVEIIGEPDSITSFSDHERWWYPGRGFDEDKEDYSGTCKSDRPYTYGESCYVAVAILEAEDVTVRILFTQKDIAADRIDLFNY